LSSQLHGPPIGDHLSVDDVREVSLETAHGFLERLAFSAASFDVHLRLGFDRYWTSAM
jgi:hypothetical protein